MTINKPSSNLFMGLFLVLLAAILFLTLMPAPPHVLLDDLPWGDKIEHFLAFGGLMLMGRLGFPRVSDWRWLEHLSFLGALIEVTQASPGVNRDCDWRDWVADSTGALIMLILMRLFVHYRATRPAAAQPVTLH